MSRLGNSIMGAGVAVFVLITDVFAVPAFPAAQGGGASTVGGRAGAIIAVTNRNDSGAGSRRAAIVASVARTVVFRVGGMIELANPLVVTNPCLTVAGQTAPGGGILLSGKNMRGTLVVIDNSDPTLSIGGMPLSGDPARSVSFVGSLDGTGRPGMVGVQGSLCGGQRCVCRKELVCQNPAKRRYKNRNVVHFPNYPSMLSALGLRPVGTWPLICSSRRNLLIRSIEGIAHHMELRS